MATKLKIIEDVADIVPAPTIPDFETAPTRNRNAGWTAERQRKFIEHLSLTGSVGVAEWAPGTTAMQLLARADDALLAAKALDAGITTASEGRVAERATAAVSG